VVGVTNHDEPWHAVTCRRGMAAIPPQATSNPPPPPSDCTSLFAWLEPNSTYYLSVDGADLVTEGLFELVVSCSDDVLLPPGFMLGDYCPPSNETLYQTYNASVEEPCTWDHLVCHDHVMGSTVGLPNTMGDPEVGEAFYRISFFKPQSIAITTCLDETDRWMTWTLSLYAEWPVFTPKLGKGKYLGSNATLVARSEPGVGCPVVMYVKKTMPACYRFLLLPPSACYYSS